MSELELYKFITERELEYHWTGEKDDVILFIEVYNLERWNKLLGTPITDENGIECVMKDGYFCFYMKNICEFFDIELNKVFEQKED